MEEKIKIGPTMKIIWAVSSIYLGLAFLAYGAGYLFGTIEKLFF